jgi:predicted glycoside hydrolase/deacetylase ChbG (UPF0249 family)
MHGGVNRAALECAAKRSVDRMSVMVTGPCWEEACRIAASHGIELSVHLNCVEPPFLGSREFPSSMAGWMRSASRRADDVRGEWRMQVERMLSAGYSPSRLDSHRHVHHLGAIREVVLDLAEEFGIGSVRAAVLPDRKARPTGIPLDSMARRLGREAASRGVEATGSVLGFSRSGRVTRRYIEKYLPVLPPGECELVMHPSTEPVWSRWQTEELDLMLSEWFERCIRGNA